MGSSLGIVAIGRNEGSRLQRCLQSALRETARVVYVDSGSTDGSQAMAQAAGASVVTLNTQVGFTAARARNAGFLELQLSQDPPEFVHFVDGDCELFPGWVERALALMQTDQQLAVVCGRNRERHPDASPYNRLCDIEWDTPVGPARACGGNALMRCSALTAVNGFREDLIAGEEPELCVRLRAAGWRIYRHPADMTWHDADIHSFSQWWKRSRRAGHAFAEGHAMHGAAPEAHFRRQMVRPWIWIVLVPLVLAFAAWTLGSWALAGLLIYPVQLLRQSLRKPAGAPLRWRGPAFLLLSKVAELQGQLGYWLQRLTRRRPALIEYKR